MRDHRAYRDLLAEYQYLSKQISVEFIEADRDPLAAQKYEITAVPTILVEANGRTERTNQADEQGDHEHAEETLEGKTKKVYFVRGHGEHDTAGQDGRGLRHDRAGDADGQLRSRQAGARAGIGKVPDDATVVVIAGPKTDLLPQELTASRRYLARGGKVMLMLDPPDADTAGAAAEPDRAREAWGSDVGNTIVIDEQSANTWRSRSCVNYPRHAITERFNGVMTAFPLARSVAPVEGGTDGKFAQKLLETSARSWAESDVKGLFETRSPSRTSTRATSRAGRDRDRASAPAAEAPPAPATPPAAGRRRPGRAEAETRVVVVGDSDFAVELGDRVPGQRGSVPEHGQLAGAAGEPDRDPAEGSRRPADRHDARAGSRPALADAARSFPRCCSATASGCGGRDDKGRP